MVLDFFVLFFFFFFVFTPYAFQKPLGAELTGREPGAGRSGLGVRHIDRQTVNTTFLVVSCYRV